MNILMLLSNIVQYDTRVTAEAEALIEAGHKVYIICWDRLKQREKKERYKGMEVLNYHNTRFMGFLPNDAYRNFFWWRGAYKKAVDNFLKYALTNRPQFKIDVVHCHDLDTLSTGVKLKKHFKCKLVFDAHENFPYMIEGYVNNFVFKHAQKMERKLIKQVDHIITVSGPLVEHLQKLTNKPITTVMNCKPLVYDRYIKPRNDVFTLVYIGVFMEERFFPDIVHLVGSMPDVKLILAGKRQGNDEFYDKVKEISNQYHNVDFKGEIPSEMILPLTRGADATFLFMTKPPFKKYFQETLFNKPFEAMVCGRPTLTTKGRYLGKFLETLECGIALDYNKEGIRNGINALKDNPKWCETLGKNAFEEAKRIYNWGEEKRKLIEVYENI